MLTTDFESIAEHKSDAKDHIVLGGEEQDRRMENVDNNTQFDANENIVVKREVQKLMLFDKVYINQVPTKILDRWVPLGAGLINGAHPLLIYTPFDTLLNTDYIKQALKTFFYMRAKVELKVVYSTSIWNYGAVFISNISGGSSAIVSNNYAWFASAVPGASGTYFGKVLSHNPIILDLSQQEEIIFDLPWISPANYLSLKSFYDSSDPANTATTNFADNMFRFAMYQTLPTGALDSSVTTDFNFNLFARFQDVTVQGFTFDSTATPAVEAQSAFVMSTLGGLAAQATPVVSSWLKAQADRAIKAGLGKAEGFMDDYLDGDEEKKVMETSDKRVEVDRQTSNVLPDMYGDLVANNQMCKAVLPARPTPSAWHRISDFVQKPSFIGSFALAGEGAAPLYFFDPYPNSFDTTYSNFTTDRIAYISQYARFWRGSFIYTLLFMTSPMVSVKFKIILVWNANDNLTSEPESLLTRIITVRGTTVVDIPVPFLYSQQWLPTDIGIIESGGIARKGPVNTPALVLSRYQPAYSPGDIPAQVHLHAWRRAGKDFAFSSLREAGSYTGDLPLVVEAQMRVNDLLSEDVALLGASDSLVFQGRDVIEFLEDIASRFSCDQTSSTTYPTPIDWVTSNGHSNVDTISNLFYFFRGSIDYKFIVTSPGTSTRVAVVASPYTDKTLRVGYTALNSVSDGEVAIDPRFTGVLEFRQPALALYDWLEMPSDGTAYYPMTNATPVLYDVLSDGTAVIFGFCLRKITADSSFYYEIPPPYSNVWASS